MTVFGKLKANQDVRELIESKGLRMYEAAEACAMESAYFSRIMARELPADKKKEIMKAIRRYKKKR